MNLVIASIFTYFFLLGQVFAGTQTTSITCNFTEPFFTLEVNLNKKTLSMTSLDWQNDSTITVTEIIAKDIDITQVSQDFLLPQYKVTDKNGVTLLELKLNMKGSDMMSELLYPFEAKFKNKDYPTPLWGGCESNLISVYNPHES